MRKTCFDMIYKLAKEDDRIVYIGSDVGAGTLQNMKEEFPDRFFMEGVSEQNIIGMATGLALSGKIVYVNTLACFLTRRCYEQVYLDVGLHNANVRLLGNGGGLVYAALGPTHIATDDISLMRNIPNMAIVACADADEMTRLMPQTVNHKGPIYIRFAMGGDPIVFAALPVPIGTALPIKMGRRALIITTGITLKLAMEVNDVTVLHMPTIKPLDYEAVYKYLDTPMVITVEEHNIIGGLGSAVAELNLGKPLAMIGLPDEYIDRYGTQESLMKYYGITTEAIEDAIS